MAFRFLSKALVGLSMFACASAFAVPLVVNVAGIESYGEQGDSGNTVLTFNVGANVTITSVSYNVNVTAFSPSYLSELVLGFTNTAGDGVYFTPSGTEDPGTETVTGSGDLVALGLSFAVGADGLLVLEFFEDFDDFDGADGIWNFGTVTFTTDAVDVPPTGDVPEPASGLLMGAGLALIGYTARRRRNAVKAA